MVLELGRHRHAGDVVAPARLEVHELDVRAQVREVDGKRRRVLLAAQRGLELRMAAVEANPVARNVGRREERQPHDVIPVQVGDEDVVGLRRSGAVAGERGLPERTQAAAQIAQHVLGAAGFDLDARRVPAVGSGDRKPQPVHIFADFAHRREDAARRAAHRGNDLLANRRRGERDRQRAARAPEADALHVVTAVQPAS